ncbi:MAG TPA: alkaline phosphatase family protein [Solirubrobacter sp.]|nr:alkaline phosphatase family protein [Solirubrobacter sp.]
MRSFADLPARIEALAREHERFAVVLLDAFGWAFVQRHADHPLLRRLQIEPVASQFPSTTTAHLTTLYTGLPVEQHGLYEWRVYEPAAGAVIRPLPWLPAGDDDPPLTIDPRDVLPPQRFFAGATVLHPQAIAGSRYGSVALAGANIVPFETIEEGAERLNDARGLTYLYWDRIDAVGHKHGPSSAAFDHTARRALDALARVETPMLVTADHGQIDVSVTDDLDQSWPDLTRHLKLPPAGSARDLFLHVDDPATVITELTEALGDRARVLAAAELFDNAGPRLRERLADVCVLPAPGRMVAISTFPSHERQFKGHHGGLTPEESQTWIGLTA